MVDDFTLTKYVSRRKNVSTKICVAKFNGATAESPDANLNERSHLNAWAVFWGCCLIVAGVSFFFITLVVAWKGFGDLESMFTHLRRQQTERHEL